VKAQTVVSDVFDRRALRGWRIIWIGTILSYFLYGAYDGDLGMPWRPITLIVILGIIAARWSIVHDTRWFTYAQTCIQASVLMTLVQLYLVVHNLATIQVMVPLMASLVITILGWIVIVYKPRPRMRGWSRR
jgi:phosphatidylserine synthase